MRLTIRIGDTEIKHSEYEKSLGIKVDTKLMNIKNDIISKASCNVRCHEHCLMQVYQRKRN